MHVSTLRGFVVGAALALGLASTSNAQGLKLHEVRLDMASLNLTGGTSLSLDFPGSASVGLFFNEKMALEPSVSIFTEKGFNAYSIGTGLAYYFQGNHGKSGVFVAPVVGLSKVKGSDSQVNYGADAGLKIPMKDKVSFRLAGTLRDGDSYNDVAFGVSFGISFYIN